MKKILISLLTVAAIVIMNSSHIVSAIEEGQQMKSKTEIIQQISEDTNGKEEIFMDESDGVQIFIKGNLDLNTGVSKDTVLSYLENNRSLFNFKNNDLNFRIDKYETDDLGFTHVKLKETYKGKDVYGREMTVHFDKSGEINSITGTLEDRIQSITKKNTQAISSSSAIEIAKSSKSYDILSEEPKAENYIYFKDGKAYDVYRVNIVYDTPEFASWEIFVDIYSGDIIEEKSLMREFNTTGSGIAVNGDLTNLNVYKYGNKYYLQDRTKDMSGYINTYTANHRYTDNGSLIYNYTQDINDPAAVSAHSYAGVVYDFYKNIFNRNSIDDNGMSIDSVVHYGSNYNNAYWNGYKMIYGDGDNVNFTMLSGDLDVVGHEMTHGVVTNTCNLNYENQSGALNESISDVFGVLIQTYEKYDVKNGEDWIFNPSDWVIGDEIYTPGIKGDALRSLANPTLYDQPDHMKNYYNLPNTENGDYGGVHINSGIPNKAAYNLASTLGCEKTARIYYRATTQYFNSTTSFVEARLGLVQAAKDLYGNNSLEAEAVGNAFSNVGIN
ncbi:M4 family metallopeptidase (plasmid) [Clostridium perfringens]